MFLDVASLLSSNQAITATAVSTGVYDTAGLGVGVPVNNIFGIANDSSFGNDIGGGGPKADAPQVLIVVGTAFAGATSLQVQLQAAVDTNNTGTPGTWDTLQETDAIPVADLTAGTIIPGITIPRRYLGQNFPRFYRLNYVVAGGPFTQGTISFAGLNTGIDDNPIYPGNF